MYQNFGWKYLLTAAITVLWSFALYTQGIPLGLDLKGGAEIIYRLEVNGRPATADVTEDAVGVLRKRIDKLGIKELDIRSMGADKVQIQIPSATQSEIEKLKTQIEKAGRLEFRLVVSDKDLKAVDRQLEIERIIDAKDRGVYDPETDPYDIAYWHPEARGGRAGQPLLLHNVEPGSGKKLYLDGSLLADAHRALDDKGRPCVGFTWGPVGARLFYEMTSKNVGEQLAVVLDGEVRSAPEIRGPIGKRGIIEGGPKGWDEKELLDLIIILKGGALPAKPVFAYSKRVGAQLGQAAVTVGGGAIVGAMVVVVIFMLVYYGLRAGLIADIALVLNLVLILGTLAMFDATLTLPGIAGILLTAGMAVDANILIYERIREELARGAAVKQAIQAGYDRAFWTIFDANLTTALTAMVLMWAGTGPIKGFGITLTIGIVVSMFTALFVTRALYGYFVVKEIVTALRFRSLFERPNIDFHAARRKAVPVSVLLICAGWLVFVLRGDEKYGIDFTGGTVMQIRLAHPVEKDELVRRLKERFGTKAHVEVQRVGAAVKGGRERGREWLLRTRLVGSGEDVARQSSRAGGLGLLAPAYGQERPPAGDAPAGDAPSGDTPAPSGDTPAPSGDTPAPSGDTPAPSGDTPSGDAPAPSGDTPSGDAPPPAEAPAPGEGGGSGSEGDTPSSGNAQDFFEHEVRRLLHDELVEPYPPIEGKPFVLTEPKDGKVRARFRVNLVRLSTGFEVVVQEEHEVKPVTAEEVKQQLPPILRKLAHRLRNAKRPLEVKRRETLLALAGPEGGEPGFQVEALPDADTSDPLFPFEFRTHELPAGNEERAAEVVDLLKNSLERAQEERASFAPAVPFPSIDQVGSAVAKNLKSKAVVSTVFCVIFICLYVWLRFDFWSGISAIVAVFHDVLALLGFLTILDFVVSKTGSTFDAKFGLTTISAFLTLVGYSINDTIVILDRIREDKRDSKAKEYTPELINAAINKTLSRTVLTSLTSLLVCVVLLVGSFFGLTAIQGFAAAMTFGIVVGTYSSVFIAAPILLSDKRRLVVGLVSLALFMLVTGIVSFFVGAPGA
ncbi:MAG: protein translocase subunit SecD [Planctomycetota bacterium]|nr:MAG: protein translocase subunit SecD [Planctomycetota bacterium]